MVFRGIGSGNDYKEVKFSQFANHLQNGDYEKINITERQLTGTKKNGDQEITYSPSALEINWLEEKYVYPMLDEKKIELESDPPESEYNLFNLLPTILMVLAMGFLFYFMMSQGGNKQAFHGFFPSPHAATKGTARSSHSRMLPDSKRKRSNWQRSSIFLPILSSMTSWAPEYLRVSCL